MYGGNIMKDNRVFDEVQLADLKGKLAVKEVLDREYREAKEAGYAATMYNVVSELADLGLIGENDKRLRAAEFQTLGMPEITVDTEQRELFTWQRESRRRYGGSKMTEEQELQYLREKGTTAGRTKNSSGESNKRSSSSGAGWSGAVSGTAKAAEERRKLGLAKNVRFDVKMYEHVGLRREYSQVGLIHVAENDVHLECKECLVGSVAVRTVTGDFEDTKFLAGFVKDTAKLKAEYNKTSAEDVEKTLLLIKKAEGSFGFNTLGAADVTWKNEDGRLVALVRIAIDKNTLFDNHIEFKQFASAVTKAVRECLAYKAGVECAVKTKIVNLGEGDFVAQKKRMSTDKVWIQRLYKEDSDALMKEVLAADERKRLAKERRAYGRK